MTSPQPYPVIQPRTVTPGIETQNPLDRVPEQGMSCRPDWIRLVGPESQTRGVVRELRNRFGPSTGFNRGAMHFQEGTVWHPGVLFSKGHKAKIVMVDLQGSRLSSMAIVDMMDITTKIMMKGFKCARIDLAVDHVGVDLALYKNALASCEAGELCKLRKYSPDPEFMADGTPTRLLLKFGKRESSVCARIYDKGLETKTLPPGQWERFEVEFKQDRAAEVCMTLLDAGDRLPEALWRYVIGAVDFRIKNGRTELSRRPRAPWWDNYIGQSHPLETSPLENKSSFLSWFSWYRSTVGPRLLQLSAILGMTPYEFFDQLMDDLKPATSVVPAIVDAQSMMDKIRDTPHQTR